MLYNNLIFNQLSNIKNTHKKNLLNISHGKNSQRGEVCLV